MGYVRSSSLFDNYSHDPNILELEKNIHVKLSMYLWSFCCGDFWAMAMVVAIFVNRINELFESFAWACIPSLLFLKLYCSVFVWYFVIQNDPTAMKYILEGTII